jgi:hypothetical protein
MIGREFEDGSDGLIDLEADIKLVLWPRRRLAHDPGLELKHGLPPSISPGRYMGPRGEVDTVMEDAEKAGARVAKSVAETIDGGMQDCTKTWMRFFGKSRGIQENRCLIETYQATNP